MDNKLNRPVEGSMKGQYSNNKVECGMKRKWAEGSRKMKDRGNRSKILVSCIITMAMVFSLLGIGTVPAFADLGGKYDLEWFSAFGGSNYDEGFSVISVEGGYVYTGTVSDDGGLEYTFLVKTDEKGDAVWEKSFGGIFRSSGRSVSQTADGGYIIVGTSKTFIESNEKVYLIKTDGEGNLQWEQKFDLSDQGYIYSKRQGFSVKEVPGGGYIIAGSIIRGESSDALVIRTNSLGVASWAQLYGGEQWDCFYDVEVVEDGFIAGGFQEKDNRAYEYIIKVGHSGELLWEHVGSSPGAHVKDLMVAADGSIMASGYRNANISVLKLGSQGIFQWGRAYDPGIGYGMAELASGDFVIAGNGSILSVKPSGVKNWVQDLTGKIAGMNVYAKDVVVNDSGAMVFTGFVSQANSDACLFQLGADRATLGVSSPNMLRDGSVYLFAPVFLDDGQIDTTLTAQVEVRVKKGNELLETIPLSDGNFFPSDDYKSHDGVYSAWYAASSGSEAGDSIDFELFVDGIKEDTKTVNVINDPGLVVLTHSKALYDGFIDTGAAATIDENGNKVPDYYDLLDRIWKYADSYRGVVLDVNEEIAESKDWEINYSDYDYNVGYHDARSMGEVIDELMDYVFGLDGSKLKNVAIIGDDEVIPFYRKKDTLFGDGKLGERDYVQKDLKGKIWGNPTLRDTGYPYIMTDVPYGTYANLKPDYDYFPLPRAGVGRIFADKPSTLIDMIDGYEVPINLIPEESYAIIFSLDSDLPAKPKGVDFPFVTDNAVAIPLETKYKSTEGWLLPGLRNGRYYWYDGDVREWGAREVIKGIEGADLSLIWSHASHVNESTQNKPDLTYTSFRSLSTRPGHMLINAGCHSGFSVSHNNKINNSESYYPYDHAIVNQIISKQIAYMAPTTYGYSANSHPTAHDLLSKVFLLALLDGASGTVGEKWRKAYEEYRNEYSNTYDDYSVTAIYGMGYYGLPTQPVAASAAGLTALNTSLSEDAASRTLSSDMMKIAASSLEESRHIAVSIGIPEPVLKVNGDGDARLEIPGGSAYTMTNFAPILPLIQKTYILPKGSTVDAVSLVSSTVRANMGPLKLQQLLPVNKTTGAVEGSFELSGLYPSERFTWSQEEREDGVYLALKAVPAQYNPESRMVSVLSSMDFDITYTGPVSSTSITEVKVNDGLTVKVDDYDIPIDVKIDAGSAGAALLQWQVRDLSGLAIESGTLSLDLIAGNNNVEFDFDTEGWAPGDKGLTLLLREDGITRTSWFGEIEVSGLYANLLMDQRVYDPSEPEVTFLTEIRDEDGAPISGLSIENFDVNVDGGPVAGLSMEESDPGSASYHFTFPLAGVEEDLHNLTLSCTVTGLSSAIVFEEFLVEEDTSAPEVIRTDPAQYEAGVASDAVITITFGETIFEGEAFAGIQLLREEEDVDVLAEVTTTISLDSLILSPVNPLELNSVYKVIIPSKALKDGNENKQIFPYQLWFVTYAEPDLAAPVVESTLPSDGETDFPAKAAVKVDFSESVGAGVNAADISWMAGGTPVPFDMTFYANQLILTPKASVPYRAACQLTIPAGAINDLLGNPLALEYSFGFTIEDAEDSQGPLLLSSVPEYEMTGVLTDALVTLKFDEIVLKGAAYLGILLTEVKDQGPGDPLDYTAELQRDTLTLTPTQNFKMNQEYVVTVPAGAVEDLIGNSLEDSIEISFSTGDLMDEKAPSIEDTIPGDGAEGVVTDSAIYVYFDEAIHEGDVFAGIALLNMSLGGEGDDLAFTWSISGRTLILIPSVNLEHSSHYRVRVPAGAVKDLTGNASEGGLIFDFSTEDAPDTQPPQLTQSSPVDGTENVSVYAQIVFTFNEFIQAGSAFNSINMVGGDGVIDFNKSISGKKLTLTVTGGGMPLSTEVTVSLPAGSISDLLGNQSDEDISINFTTVTEDIVDSTPPVTSHSIFGTAGVADWYTSPVKVTLTAEDDYSGVALTSWSLDGTNWSNYAGAFTVHQQGAVTVYYRSEDVTGNVEVVKSFTVNIDTVSPSVSSSLPANGAFEVPVNQIINITFTENISGGGTYGDINLTTTAGSVSISKEISGKVLTIRPSSMGYDTSYTLAIPAGAVVDTAGNSQAAEYTTSFTTKSEDSAGGIGGGGGGGDVMTPPEEIDVTGSVDDKEHPFVKAGERDVDSGVLPIEINNTELNRVLSAGGFAPRVAINIASAESFLFTGLTGQTVKNMEELNYVLEINTGLAGYTIPAELLDIDEIAEQFGEGVALQDIAVNVRVAAPTADWIEIVDNAGKEEFQILIPPVEFTIECSYNGRTIPVENFRAPVERTIPVPAGIDPNKITTAVVVERDGTLRHVPTRIIVIDGVYYAKVTSLTNSVYTLIWNPVSFCDMEGHWAKEYVNDLGSRLVVAGVSDGFYNPDRPVTRAELAAIITRSLGVKNLMRTCKFTDVSEGDWFLGAVNTAREYGIVSGYGDKTFKPMQMVTREEGFAMIARAMILAGLKTGFATELMDAEVEDILNQFDDRKSLSLWCEKSAAFAISSGIVSGYDGKLYPKDKITRAEAATIVRQMLKNTELIRR